MGFINWFSDLGSIGSTTKWAINGYDELKSQDKKKSDLKIFEEMIKVRYLSMPNESHENHLLTNIKNLPGLAGLVIEILNVEAELSLNDGNVVSDMVKPIFTRLEKTDLSSKTKYGNFGPPKHIRDIPLDINDEFWHLDEPWIEFIYTFSRRQY